MLRGINAEYFFFFFFFFFFPSLLFFFFFFFFFFRILYTCIFYFYIPFYSPPIQLPLSMVQSETIVYTFCIGSHHLSHPLYKCHMGIFPFPDLFLRWFHQLL